MTWIITGAIGLFAVGVISLQWHYHQKVKRLSKQINLIIDTMSQFEMEKHTLLNADLRFNEQLKDIHQQILSLDKQIQSNNNIRDNDGGYQHALKILAMGGTKEEIMESCHLSNAEAELLMNLDAYRMAMEK